MKNKPFSQRIDESINVGKKFVIFYIVTNHFMVNIKDECVKL